MKRTTQDPASPMILRRARRGKLDQATKRDVELVLATSHASEYLSSRFEEYVRGDIGGSSILICGHRGGGKTTTINQAFVTALNNCQKAEAPCTRPLLVRLPAAQIVIDRNRQAAVDATAAPPTEPPAEPVDPPGGDKAKGDDREAGKSPAANNGNGQPNADEPTDDGPAAPPTPENLGTTLLKAITESLHQALTLELSQCFTENAKARSQAELGAELALRMDDPYGPTAEQLSVIWRTAAKRNAGIFFSKPSQPAKQAAREMLAVASVCYAYRRVTGSYSVNAAHSNKTSNSASLTQKANVGFSGGLLNAIFGFSSESTDEWSRKRELMLSQQFEAPLNIDSLSRELVKIFERLKDAGLYPIFVWDGLDRLDEELLDETLSESSANRGAKTESPVTRLFDDLTRHLKAFLHEHVIFCFAADRTLYSHVQSSQDDESYSEMSSSYRFSPYVCHAPENLDAFLEKRLANGITDSSFLRRLVLHRGRMHPLDVTREADIMFRNDQSETSDLLARYLGYSNYRFEFLLQLAVELALDGAEMRGLVDRDPRNLQLGIDAVYYVSRLWRKALPNNQTQVRFGEEFRAYMRTRGGGSTEHLVVLERVSQLVANFMADYPSLKQALVRYRDAQGKYSASYLNDQASQLLQVLEDLEQAGRGSTDFRFTLLLQENANAYTFIHTPAGPRLDWIRNAGLVVHKIYSTFRDAMIPQPKSLGAESHRGESTSGESQGKQSTASQTSEREEGDDQVGTGDSPTHQGSADASSQDAVPDQVIELAKTIDKNGPAPLAPPASDDEYETMIELYEVARNVTAHADRFKEALVEQGHVTQADLESMPEVPNADGDESQLQLVRWVDALDRRIHRRFEDTREFASSVRHFTPQFDDLKFTSKDLSAGRKHASKDVNKVRQVSNRPETRAEFCHAWGLPAEYEEKSWQEIFDYIKSNALPKREQEISEYEKEASKQRLPYPAELSEWMHRRPDAATQPEYPKMVLRVWQSIHKAAAESDSAGDQETDEEPNDQ